MSEMNEKSALLPKSKKIRRRSRNHSFTQSLYVDFSSLMSGSSDQRRSSNSERRFLSVPEPDKLLSRVRILSTQSGILVSELEGSFMSTVSTSFGPVIVQSDREVPSSGIVLGICLAILSALLFTANHFLFQYWHMHETDVLLTRGLLQSVTLGLVIFAMKCCRTLLPSTCLEICFVLLQGVLSGIRVGLTFVSLQFIPIGDALTIIMTEPIWTLILSKMFLKTPIGIWKLGFSCSLLVGVILCAQPPFMFKDFIGEQDEDFEEDVKSEEKEEPQYFSSEGYNLGLACAIGTGVISAVTNILVSKCSAVSSLVLTFWSGFGAVVVAVIYGILFDTRDVILSDPMSLNFQDYLNFILLAAFGLLGFLLLTRALQLIPPTTVAVIRVTEIVMAYVLQSLFMNQVPNSLATLGSSLVIISVIGVSAENLVLYGTFNHPIIN